MIVNLGLVTALSVFVWVLSVRLKNASIADIYWGSGFVLISWSQFFQVGYSTRGLLLSIMATIWGVRLAGYLFWRNAGKPEDKRYRAMRDSIGPSFVWVSFFSVFLLQVFLMWLVSFPLQLGQTSLPLYWFDAFAIAIFVLGMAFEAGGDWQLSSFLADPKNRGKVMDKGFWRYTRHPNYFGDCCVWWAFGWLALSAGAPWWSFAGTLLMTFLLLRVSGVSMLEKTIVARRPDYAAYIRRTSAFFPMPPKQNTQEVGHLQSS